MGDKYEITGQVGAVGRQAQAQNMSFVQHWEQMSKSVDLAQLASELRKLREVMEGEATEPSHKLAVGAVAAAEESASRNDGAAMLTYLKTSGKWALNVAEKIGVDVATAALKGALGI
jgi:hypothetical protein